MRARGRCNYLTTRRSPASSTSSKPGVRQGKGKTRLVGLLDDYAFIMAASAVCTPSLASADSKLPSQASDIKVAILLFTNESISLRCSSFLVTLRPRILNTDPGITLVSILCKH